MNTTHRPDPEFVGNLERELRSTIRRQGRFDNGSSARAKVILRLRWTTGVVALAAMCIGSAATLAVSHRLRAQTADLIIARSEAHLEFANARLELFREELQEAESRVAAGVLTPKEADSIRHKLVQVEAGAAARALDAEESQITGRDPDNALSAPIVRGRDFVTERLELEQAVLLERVAWIDKLATADWRLEWDQASRMPHEQQAARAAASMVGRRLALRQDYLTGTRTARQVELADMQSSVELQREMAARHVKELQPQLDRIHMLVEEGLATRSEARPVEMAFRAAVLQHDLAELELQILERKLGNQSVQ